MIVQGTLWVVEDKPLPVLDLLSYDKFIVYFSGGKDSMACLLHLIEQGVPTNKIELHHHLIDVPGEHFMDWPVTPAYCKAIARHFGLTIRFSWKEGGFRRELLKENAKTAPISFETSDGVVTRGGTMGKVSTRRRFPQKGGDMTTRWCSPTLKIDVASCQLRNDPDYSGIRILTLSGERADESPGRAKYEMFEPDRADLRNGIKAPRHMDRWRPIHQWKEPEVWAIMERHGINPHPAYRLGWGRCSCMFCIFGNKNQWASSRVVNPVGFIGIAELESEFGWIIDREKTVIEMADAGKPYEMDARMMQVAMSEEYDEPVIISPWVLPLGAFGESCGPS